jgi:PAS domain S-box-containing protein
MSDLTRLLLDHVPQMLLLVAPVDLRIVLANRAAVDMLGYPEQTLIGKPIGDIESSLQDVFYWQEVQNGQLTEINNQEGLYLRADGSLLPVRKTVRLAAQGGASLLAIEAIDITDERQDTADLAQVLSQLRATLEATGNGILVIDLQGRIASMNRLCGTMWRIADAMLLAQDDAAILDFIAGQVEEPVSWRSRFDAIMDEGEKSDLLHLSDGRVFECKSRPQFLGERTIGRVFGFSDITDRIRIERELKAAAIAAESANRAKTDFLAMMSHEIRTPINGVMGMAALMLDTPLDAEQQRYLDNIRSSSDALLSIINDILDFSKIEARKLVLENIDFNLLGLLEDIADLYGLRAAEKDIEFTLRIDPDVPLSLRGDPGRLRQILTNLIGNSIKFTHSGGISLAVSRRPASAAQVRLSFTVNDTGIGIPADRIDKIFQPFEQADSSTTRRYGGSGLGLAITRQLVELMAGGISVSSIEGQGSSFEVTVLLDPSIAVNSEPTTPSTGDSARLHGLRTLVIDDNADARDNLVSLLAQWGLVAEGVADGDEALRRLADRRRAGTPYRLLIMDMNLSGIDGETLGRTIRQDPVNSELAMILCTAAGYRGDARRFEQAGFAAYLCKPIRRALLLDCLLSVLGSGGSRPERIVTRHTLTKSGRSNARLLVVEDNDVNLLVMQGVLRKLGFGNPDIARDGVEAVDAALHGSHDLILMDCQMPRMDGYEASRALRAAGLKVPIIALTAHAMSGDREKCLAAGMDDYLSKPIATDSLSRMLDRWLSVDPGAPRPAVPSTGGTAGGQNPPTDEEFDYDQFMELLMGDRELAASLLDIFRDSTLTTLAKLRHAIDSGDVKGAVIAAHTIKGASANLSAKAMRAVASEIESACNAGNLEHGRTLLPELEAKRESLLRHPRLADLFGSSAP